MANRDRSSATTPGDNNSLKISKPKKVAAGIPAANSSLLHGIKKMGVTKTIKTLTLVNQPDGFDCPGVWPDPDHSSPSNSAKIAKAVADEATSKRITAEF